MDNKGKTILILGNGFDLAHNLPTGYADFMDFCEHIADYLKASDSIEESIHWAKTRLKNWRFHNDVRGYMENTLYTLHSVENDSYKDEAEETIRLVQDLYNCIKENIWYLYFKNVQIKGKKWIDFEREIRIVIEFIDKRINDIDQECVRSNFSDDDKFKHIRPKFIDPLFKMMRKDVILARELREKCFIDLNMLTRALEIYLARFVERIECEKLDIISSIHPDYIINFNYTNTYEKTYANKNVFHIHGKCCEKRSSDENNMVLGINEYWENGEEDKNTNFSVFKKFVQRIVKKTGVDNFEYLKEIEMIYKKCDDEENTYWKEYPSGISYVYLFGHSLDITDKDILEGFMGNEATVVTVYCKDNGAQGELIENTIKLIRQKRLLEKANSAPPKIKFEVVGTN